MNYNELAELTGELLIWNNRTLQMFQKRVPGVEADFYKDIKPFVDELDIVVEKWKVAAEQWVQNEKPKYIHKVQIQQGYDNLKQSALECFGAQTRKKRFTETHQAIEFLLNSMLHVL